MRKQDSDPDGRQERVRLLRRQVEETCGGEIEGEVSPKCPPELEELFWRQVLAYEKAPISTLSRALAARGVGLPAAETLDDEALTARLWEVIRSLEEMRVFLSHTDHLSDRELYSLLTESLLEEEGPVAEDMEGMNCHIDVVGSGSDRDTYLYLKHYADDEWRRSWAGQFPEDTIPEHEDPPYDRDARLPGSDTFSGE